MLDEDGNLALYMTPYGYPNKPSEMHERNSPFPKVVYEGKEKIRDAAHAEECLRAIAEYYGESKKRKSSPSKPQARLLKKKR